MAFWIFKVAEQDYYPDTLGKRYVYDNTHSVRVKPGDTFIYLDKTRKYSFTGTGIIKRLLMRDPSWKEAARTEKVRVVYTAHLSDVVWFTEPLTISPSSKQGRRNRALLGILDANLLGWSQSIPALNEEMYKSIMGLAELNRLIPAVSSDDYSVPDKWSHTKSRPVMKGFTEPVLDRSNRMCVVCGSSLPGIVEAAHLIPYATDVRNRANPANGICLCKYCHRALDLRLIAIRPNGALEVSPEIVDPVARFHFSQVKPQQRKGFLEGVDPFFLNMTVKWFEESLVASGYKDRHDFSKK